MGTGLGHFIPLIAYLGFWIMCVVSLTGRPIYGLYYIMPFLPYRTMRDHFSDYPLSSNTVTILLLCILLGAMIKGDRPPASRMYLTWFLFAGYLYFSLWIGTALGHAPPPIWTGDANFTAWKDYMMLPLLLLASGMVIQDRKHVRTVIAIVAVSLILVDRSALLESLSHSWAVFDESKRTSGPLEYGPNQLAAFLAQFGMFFWGCAVVLKRYKVKLAFYALTGLTMVTTLYAFSRAAYIAVIVAVAVLALVKDRKLLVVLALFLFTWQAFVPAAVTERMSMTTDESGQLDQSAQERIDLWTQSRDMFLNSPIVGQGFATFQYGEHAANLKDTHNYFVKVLVETGILGALFFVTLLYQMLASCWRVFRRTRFENADRLFHALGLGTLLMATSCIVANLFGDRWTYIEINGLLWVLMGALLRVDVMTKAEPSKGQQPLKLTAFPAPIRGNQHANA